MHIRQISKKKRQNHFLSLNFLLYKKAKLYYTSHIRYI